MIFQKIAGLEISPDKIRVVNWHKVHEAKVIKCRIYRFT